MTIKTPEQIARQAMTGPRWAAVDPWGVWQEGREAALIGAITSAIEADRAQRHHRDGEIYLVQNDTGGVVGVFRDADEATAAYQDGYSIIQETVWEPGEYAAARIQHLTSEWEETVNYGRGESEEPYRASDYAISEDDWRAGLDDDEASEIVRLIEWQEARA